MNLKNKIFILLAGAVLFGSCKKNWNLKITGLSPEDATANDANIKRLLQGGYDA
jgi:hypothetical protein